MIITLSIQSKVWHLFLHWPIECSRCCNVYRGFCDSGVRNRHFRWNSNDSIDCAICRANICSSTIWMLVIWRTVVKRTRPTLTVFVMLIKTQPMFIYISDSELFFFLFSWNLAEFMNHGIFVKFPMSSRADIMQWQNMVRKCRIFFYWCHNAKRRCAYSKARACTFFLFNRNRRIPKFQACKHSCTLWCWYALTMARRAESTEEENDMGKKKRKSVIAQWKIRKSFKPFNFPSAIVYTTLADKGIWCSCSFYHRLKIRFLKAKKKKQKKKKWKGTI